MLNRQDPREIIEKDCIVC